MRKTNNFGSDQVRHKPGCTVTEDDWRLEILDLEIVEELYYPCSENKGADQLRGLRLCLRICRLLAFSCGGSYCIYVVVIYLSF